MSPVQHDQNNRVNTPQNLPNQAYAPGISAGQGYGQNYATPGMPPTGLSNSLPAPQVPLSQNLQQRQHDLQRQYQMRLQQQAQQLQTNNLGMHNRQPTSGLNPMLGAMGQQATQLAGSGQRPAQQTSLTGVNSDHFLRNVGQLMMSRNKPFNPSPMVCGRPLNLTHLYMIVMKAGGCKRVTTNNQWTTTASMLGFNPAQIPTAAQEVKQVYEDNLVDYERDHLARQKQLQAQKQAQQMAGVGTAPQMSPTKMMPIGGPDNQAAQQYMLQQQQRVQAQAQAQAQVQVQQSQVQAQQQQLLLQQQQQHQQPQQQQQQLQQYQQQLASVQQPTPLPNNTPTPTMNGQTPPQGTENVMSRQQKAFNQNRSGSIGRPPDATPPNTQRSAFLTPPTAASEKTKVPPSNEPNSADRKSTAAMPKRMLSQDSPHYKPCVKKMEYSYGGYKIAGLALLGADLEKLRPDVPNLEEMGVIDIRALSMSIQSGIHGEV
ncbi:hypothetical protein LTR60_005308, partial [Cryomyces antarcticus]